MGYGLPAAMGAQLAFPNACVINIAGDGSFMMNVQELATVARYGLPIKILVFDNQSLGMVRQWQELFFSDHFSHVDLSDKPDFVRVAQAFGIEAFRIEKSEDVPGGIDRLLSHCGPLLCHVVLERQTHVWPFVPPGHPNSTMLEGALP